MFTVPGGHQDRQGQSHIGVVLQLAAYLVELIPVGGLGVGVLREGQKKRFAIPLWSLLPCLVERGAARA